jgi:uncharacterized membrane protein
MVKGRLPEASAMAVAVLLVLDFLWLILAGTGKRFQDVAAQIGSIKPWASWQKASFAAGAYLLLSLALLMILSQDQSIGKTLLTGLLAGLVIYGVFDLTNLVVFGRGYPLSMAASDICWGTFVMGVSALAGALLRERLRRSC